jgi:hypothetical protein
MKAVKDYVKWILTYGDILCIATDLQWATMPRIIAERSLDILEHMSCTRFQKIHSNSSHSGCNYFSQGKHFNYDR